MNMCTNEITSDNSEQKDVHLSNGNLKFTAPLEYENAQGFVL